MQWNSNQNEFHEKTRLNISYKTFSLASRSQMSLIIQFLNIFEISTVWTFLMFWNDAKYKCVYVFLKIMHDATNQASIISSSREGSAPL